MYLSTPYITADTCDVEEEADDLTGVLCFIFGSIIQIISFTATGIFERE